LAAFVRAFGHARVAEGYVQGGFPLGDWLVEQRRAARAGRLPADRIAELERLGVARVRRSGRSS
jgi:hypothetical protein